MGGYVFDIGAECANCGRKRIVNNQWLECTTSDDRGKKYAAEAVHAMVGDCSSCKGKIWKINYMRITGK